MDKIKVFSVLTQIGVIALESLISDPVCFLSESFTQAGDFAVTKKFGQKGAFNNLHRKIQAARPSSWRSENNIKRIVYEYKVRKRMKPLRRLGKITDKLNKNLERLEPLLKR